MPEYQRETTKISKYEDTIPDEMFDLSRLKSERFLGKIHKCRIQEGSLPWSAGQLIWYLEVENLSRPFPWGNVAKEIKPMRGSNTLWTRLIEAFNNIGIDINPATMKAQEGRILWFEMSDLRLGERVIKNFIYPVGVPTSEEIEQTLSLRGIDVPNEDPESLILSIADGMSREELISSSMAMFPEIFSKRERVLSVITSLIKSGKMQLEGGKFKTK